MKTNYTFKVGDRVQFKTWEEMEKEFGLDSDGDINCGFCFSKVMQPLCGTTATINVIDGCAVKLGEFQRERIPTELEVIFTQEFHFHTDMLKPVKEDK